MIQQCSTKLFVEQSSVGKKMARIDYFRFGKFSSYVASFQEIFGPTQCGFGQLQRHVMVILILPSESFVIENQLQYSVAESSVVQVECKTALQIDIFGVWKVLEV